ncbi:PIG-L family deacetylase [Sphingobacteriales bacterium UPWRP_1]|nr:GlcNAc-PI de-N-acetylase [Sphingobacteriales bacterium TSM_CSS]PSJ76695.1 PIG-L family deacetylase [Sphingobacteriales bacterium UPWRP_1]
MNVLVVSAHPDDEVIGCGGTLLKHNANGDKIAWIIVTNISEEFGFSAERVLSRQTEIETVKNVIGIDELYQLNYPTMQLDNRALNKMVPQIAQAFHKFNPETIYILNRSDAHSDHRITFDAVMACTKSFRHPYIKRVLMYECVSETEFAPALSEKAFLPNYFVDISEYFKKKIDLLSIYQSEMGEHPFPRSYRNIEALAIFRGAVAGVEYAEAFQLLKYIDK